jgi:hypothetical protein
MQFEVMAAMLSWPLYSRSLQDKVSDYKNAKVVTLCTEASVFPNSTPLHSILNPYAQINGFDILHLRLPTFFK